MAALVPAMGGRLGSAELLSYVSPWERGEDTGEVFPLSVGPTGDGWKFSELFSTGKGSAPFKRPG